MNSSKRRHDAFRVSKNRKQLISRNCLSDANYFASHNWFKHHPMDCGRSHCWCCDKQACPKAQKEYMLREVLLQCAELIDEEQYGFSLNRIH